MSLLLLLKDPGTGPWDYTVSQSESASAGDGCDGGFVFVDYEVEPRDPAMNLYPQSDTLGLSWTATGVTKSTVAASAPDGTSSSGKLLPSAGTSVRKYSYGTTLSNVVTAATFSVYLKQFGTLPTIRLYARPGIYADFDLTGVSVTAKSGLISAAISAESNGYVRASITFFNTAAFFGDIQFNQGLAWTWDSVSYLHVWGAQYNYGGLIPYVSGYAGVLLMESLPSPVVDYNKSAAESLAPNAFSFVGSFNLTSLNSPIDLTSIGTAPGDLIVFVGSQTQSSTSSGPPTVAESGYTEIVNAVNVAASIRVLYKIAGSDTAVTLININNSAAAVYVFRGIDAVSPLDVVSSVVNGSSGVAPDSPAITATSNDVVISVAAVAYAGNSGTPTSSAPSGYLRGVLGYYDAASGSPVVGVAYKSVAAGAENPPSWPGFSSPLRSIAVTLAFKKAVSTVVDSAGSVYSLQSSASEASASVDSPSALADFVTATSEPSVSSDALAGAIDSSASASEPSSGSDANDGTVTSGSSTVTESASAAELAGSLYALLASVGESPTMSDSLSAVASFFSVQQETLTTSEVVSAVANFVSASSEPASAADVLDLLSSILAALTESGASSDVLTAVAGLVSAALEAAASTESSNSSAGFTAAESEPGALSDTVLGVAAWAPAVVEVSSSSESSNGASALLASTPETALAVEATSSFAGLVTAMAEGVSALESASALASFLTSSAESASSADAAASSGVFVAGLLESVSATESSSALGVLAAAVVEAGAGSDVASAVAGFLAAIAELSVADGVPTALAGGTNHIVDLSADASAQESATSVFSLLAALSEALISADSAGAVATLLVSLLESATPLDSTSASASYLSYGVEPLGSADSAAAVLNLLSSLSEAAAVSDSTSATAGTYADQSSPANAAAVESAVSDLACITLEVAAALEGLIAEVALGADAYESGSITDEVVSSIVLGAAVLELALANVYLDAHSLSLSDLPEGVTISRDQRVWLVTHFARQWLSDREARGWSDTRNARSWVDKRDTRDWVNQE